MRFMAVRWARGLSPALAWRGLPLDWVLEDLLEPRGPGVSRVRYLVIAAAKAGRLGLGRPGLEWK